MAWAVDFRHFRVSNLDKSEGGDEGRHVLLRPDARVLGDAAEAFDLVHLEAAHRRGTERHQLRADLGGELARRAKSNGDIGMRGVS